VLKKFVKNRARAEGCMAESYLATEYVAFMNRDNSESAVVGERFLRYDDSPQGRPIGASQKFRFFGMNQVTAHKYVLLNSEISRPYVA
jgi:hypothetical protein